MPRTLVLRLRKVRPLFSKNLHSYLDISIRKESTANIGGDGPNILYVEHEFQSLKHLAIQRNGITISRLRKNSPFKIDAIDTSIFQSTVLFSNLNQLLTNPYKIGNIVTKINEIDLLGYDNISATKLLASTSILSITIFSPNEYKSMLRRSLKQNNSQNIGSNKKSTPVTGIANNTVETETAATETTPTRRNLNINFERERSTFMIILLILPD